MKVLVTGAAGHLARVLLPHLCADASIAQVVGLDVRRPRFAHPKLGFVERDVRDPTLAHDLDGCDAIVHLAFVVMQSQLGRARHDRALMRDINVNGSMHVARLAIQNGVRKFVFVSSAAIYALPASTPIDEHAQHGGLPGFGYAEDKIAVEAQLDELAAQTKTRIVRLRPHVILGPRAQPALKNLLRLPFYPRLGMPAPQLQCVHEDDVSEAIRLALFAPVSGAFNLAAEVALSYEELMRALHGKVWPLPFALVRTAIVAAWHVAGAGTDPAWVAGLREDIVLDTTRAKAELRWRPRYDSVDAARAAITRRRVRDR